MGRRGRGLLVGALVLGVAALSAFAPSRAVREAGAIIYPAEAGGPQYVGLVGMVDKPVTVFGAWPRTNAAAQVFVCQPASDTVPFTSGTAAVVAEHCATLEPVGFGTRLDPNSPEGNADEYLVVRVDTDPVETVAFCGLRMLYRSGVRVVYKSNAGGTDAVWNSPVDPMVDHQDPCAD